MNAIPIWNFQFTITYIPFCLPPAAARMILVLPSLVIVSSTILGFKHYTENVLQLWILKLSPLTLRQNRMMKPQHQKSSITSGPSPPHLSLIVGHRGGRIWSMMKKLLEDVYTENIMENDYKKLPSRVEISRPPTQFTLIPHHLVLLWNQEAFAGKH